MFVRLYKDTPVTAYTMDGQRYDITIGTGAILKVEPRNVEYVCFTEDSIIYIGKEFTEEISEEDATGFMGE